MLNNIFGPQSNTRKNGARPKKKTKPTFRTSVTWRRKWQPIPLFLPEKFHGQRSLVAYSPKGHKELDTTVSMHMVLLHWTWQSFLGTSGKAQVTRGNRQIGLGENLKMLCIIRHSTE